MKCKICNRECKNFISLCRHTRMLHDIGILEYHQKYENFIIPMCGCGKECKHRAGINFYKTCNDRDCVSKIVLAGYTPKVRERMSILKKKWISENPEKHLWNIRKKKSVPCDQFKKILSENNISFVEEFRPLEDRFFSIDIAFPDKKIGIEINGNQHYNQDKTLKDYYLNRHNLIESVGWKLYEFHFSIVYSPNELNTLIQFLKHNHSLDNFDYSFYIKEKKTQVVLGQTVKQFSKLTRKYGNRKQYGKSVSKSWEAEQQKYIPLILNSDIDFTKFGWVGRVAPIIGQKTGKVNKWMKRIMPKFYEEKCFKRTTLK